MVLAKLISTSPEEHFQLFLINQNFEKFFRLWANNFRQVYQNGILRLRRSVLLKKYFLEKDKFVNLFWIWANIFWILNVKILAWLSKMHSTNLKEHFGCFLKKHELVQSELTDSGEKSAYWGKDFPFVIQITTENIRTCRLVIFCDLVILSQKVTLKFSGVISVQFCRLGNVDA